VCYLAAGSWNGSGGLLPGSSAASSLAVEIDSMSVKLSPGIASRDGWRSCRETSLAKRCQGDMQGQYAAEHLLKDRADWRCCFVILQQGHRLCRIFQKHMAW